MSARFSFSKISLKGRPCMAVIIGTILRRFKVRYEFILNIQLVYRHYEHFSKSSPFVLRITRFLRLQSVCERLYPNETTYCSHVPCINMHISTEDHMVKSSKSNCTLAKLTPETVLSKVLLSIPFRLQLSLYRSIYI